MVKSINCFDALPCHLKTLIWEYDSSYRDKFNKVLDEWSNLLKLYDKLFWENNMIKRNIWKQVESVEVWISKYGVNYNPNHFILNYIKRFNNNKYGKGTKLHNKRNANNN